MSQSTSRTGEAWRWLCAYVEAMTVAALVVTLAAGGIGTG
jgi:hypothetical protein